SLPNRTHGGAAHSGVRQSRLLLPARTPGWQQFPVREARPRISRHRYPTPRFRRNRPPRPEGDRKGKRRERSVVVPSAEPGGEAKPPRFEFPSGESGGRGRQLSAGHHRARRRPEGTSRRPSEIDSTLAFVGGASASASRTRFHPWEYGCSASVSPSCCRK